MWQSLHQILRIRNLLLLAGIVTCLYAIVVLVYVQTVPDLGLRSAFNRKLTNVRPQLIRKVILPKGEELQHSDEVTHIAFLPPIESWPDLLNAPNRIQEEINQRIQSNRPLPEGIVKESPEDGGRYLVNVKLVRWIEQKGSDKKVKKELVAQCVLGRLPLSELAPSILWFLLKLLLFVVGVLVLWKRPNAPASTQFYLLCVVTLGAYIAGYHWMHITTSPPLLVGFIICAVLLAPVTLHFYLVFPRPKTMLVKRRVLTLLGVYGLPSILLAVLLAQYVFVRVYYHGWLFYHNWEASPEVIEWWLETGILSMLRVFYVTLACSAIWYLFSIAALLHSLSRAADIVERNQVRCILLGAVLSLAPIGYSLVLAFFFPRLFGAGGAAWPMFVASAMVTVAFIVGITRYRLMELDQVISSGAVYFLISFLVGLAYYAVLFLGTLVFNQVIEGPPLADALKVSTVALVLIVVLDLARSRFRRALDRRYHREKYHLDRTLQRMGQAVEQLVDPPTLVQRLLHAVSDLLGVRQSAVYLRDGKSTSFRLAGWVGRAPVQGDLDSNNTLALSLVKGAVLKSSLPEAAGAESIAGQLIRLEGELAYPLTHEGRLLAFLVLGPKTNGDYRQEDLNLLGACAQITVLALGSAEGHESIEQLNTELQIKVDKIADQQRRIYALQNQLRRQGSIDEGPSHEPAQKDWKKKRSMKSANGRTASPTVSDNDRSGEKAQPYFDNIIGSSEGVQQLLHLVRKVAPTDSVVLIRGESGTGKELLAEAIHQNSVRAGKAFVKVHCAALTATLLESELFGHVKGAFTGAHRDKMGRFESANGGTLFLDEIGDISLEVQTKLLRVLQEKAFERVGSSESIKVDVRIIAATHQNLEELIRRGSFRDDLYYRLNVFPVVVPPLRQRKEDITELALHFLHDAAKRCGKPALDIDDEALTHLKTYEWPGNIRQLENFIERAVVLVEGSTIRARDLPEEVRTGALLPGAQSAPNVSAVGRSVKTNDFGIHSRSRSQREQLEREHILQALANAGGNKAEAARHLGMARSTLVSRLKKYGDL